MAQPESRFQRPLTALLALAMLLVSLLSGAHPAQAAGSISLTTAGAPYSQNFDTLATNGTSSTLPQGWDFAEAGASANTIYSAGTGSSTTGDTYSFGATANTERAFGGLQSGSLIPTIGASFTNNTGATITDLAIAYTGEQWRLGTVGRADRLDFQLSTDAITLTAGTWLDQNSLDFTSPFTGTAGALNGNATANHTTISNTITGLNIPNSAVFWIRWADLNASGNDDGLAIDDFSLTPAANNTSPTGAGSASPNTVPKHGCSRRRHTPDGRRDTRRQPDQQRHRRDRRPQLDRRLGHTAILRRRQQRRRRRRRQYLLIPGYCGGRRKLWHAETADQHRRRTGARERDDHRADSARPGADHADSHDPGHSSYLAAKRAAYLGHTGYRHRTALERLLSAGSGARRQ
jgi:hypothetical protein